MDFAASALHVKFHIGIQFGRLDPERAEQLRQMLVDRSWREVAEFASYHCQASALNLKPHEEPPSVADENDPEERDKGAQRLLRRMLAAGLSRFDPDPVAALRAHHAAHGK